MSDAIALIPGAGGQGWLWHLVEADLRARGFDAFAIDLPAADESCGLPAYADTVVAAIGDRTDVTLVAQSMGGFTAPLVWQRVPTRGVVFVNAMIPLPGETAGDWWGDVGSHEALVKAAARARLHHRVRRRRLLHARRPRRPRRVHEGEPGPRDRHDLRRRRAPSRRGRPTITVDRRPRRPAVPARAAAAGRPRAAWAASPSSSRVATSRRSATRPSWPTRSPRPSERRG